MKQAAGAETHYVYDDFDLLRYVLSPEASQSLTTQSGEIGDYTNNTTIQNLCYYYEYDDKKRMKLKKLPGKAVEYMIYDPRGRLVLLQDGNLRKDTLWLFTKYDILNRPIITGKYYNDQIPEPDAMQSHVNSLYDQQTKEYYETLNIEHEYGYTNNSFPDIESRNCEVHTISFYDNYDYILSSQFNGRYSFQENELDFMFLPVNYRTRGLLTATKTRLLETKDLGTISVDWVLSANYYDKYNQLIQILTDNHFGSLDIISNKINFTGQLLTTKTNHRSNTTYTIVETQFFEYDHSGRLINTFHQLGSTKPVHLSNQVYYDYGSLKDKKLHEVSGKWTQSILYKYNIRGWLTDINDIDKQGDDYYCMKLKYDDADNPQYNGNIGQVFYKYTIGEGNHLFSYDELNRLTAAEYSGNGDFSASYSYDLNGNIQSLNRDGLIGESIWGAIDELSYTYTGNQLMAVDDNTAAQYQNNGYSDHGSFEPQEFAYDNNGNMTNDLNKRTMNLEYNYLNLPNKIQILNQDGLNSIYYIYDAAGNKLRKQTETEGTIVKTTDYLGNFVYEDNKLSFILTAEGRITPKEGGGYDYQYFIKDHLGNARVLFNVDSLQQVNMYYPFGMLADGMRLNQSLSNDNRYLYNGKELQDDFGLDWYDYGARFYDAQLGRWHSADLLAENYNSWSPYNYALNNPIKFIDPDGREVYFHGEDASKAVSALQKKTSLKLTYDTKTHMISATGESQSKLDTELMGAIGDKGIKVNLYTTKENSFQSKDGSIQTLLMRIKG